MTRLPLITSLLTALFIGATSLMPTSVYSSWWWVALWASLALAIAWACIRTKLWRRPLILALHISFLLILAGGGATFILGERGQLHIESGKSKREYERIDGARCPLPTTLTLKQFRIEHYPGMSFPRDFHSEIATSDGRILDISLNRIGRLDGYRLYQSGFDGKGGSILTVSHDPWGTGITYSGYLLYAISGLLLLISKASASIRHNMKGHRMLIISAVICGGTTAQAAPAIAAEEAEKMESRQVIFAGRVMPFAEAARDITLKLTGSDHPASLTPTRFVLSICLYPKQWLTEPILKIGNHRLASTLRAKKGYISPSELYDSNGKYRPEHLFKGGDGPLDKDIIRLDEKIAIIGQLHDGSLIELLDDRDSRRRDENSIKAALAYTRVQPLRWQFILYFCIAALSTFAALTGCRRSMTIPALTAGFLGLGTFAWHWVAAGYAPLASTPEILQFTSCCIMLTGSIAARRSNSLTGATALTAGIPALVAWICSKNPQLTPLMPVLNSGWLSLHVSIVMLAYALLLFTFPTAILGLCRPKETARHAAIAINVLMPGVYLLGLGIITGALWANVSWGRYWAWDPKETWALVTMIIYSIPLHRSMRLRQHPRALLIYLCPAVLSIIMTYAGVNYLDSLHAYQ